MTVLEEIRECFASTQINEARLLKALPTESPAYVMNIAGEFGVAVKVGDDVEISESFNSCYFYTQHANISGETANFLILSSPYKEYRYEFATFCAEFADPGTEGKFRADLIANPLGWWKRWRDLIGNVAREKSAYSVIAEMVALDTLYKTDKKVMWSAEKAGTHDIEGINESYEVKSTIKRYGTSMTVSGQFQLMHEKPLWIYFCRMEQSSEGLSINDAKKMLVDDGYNESLVEKQLEKMGFPRGSSSRQIKYKILEKKKYLVDESFPCIMPESFKDNQYPVGITHIQYTIDLDGLSSADW